MAESPSHRLGQIIGSLLERMLVPQLEEFCRRRGLFLDRQGNRGKARPGKKVTWEDRFGNAHDLDFVIERGGTADARGRPVAFIEAAWRRYTKHSRNKVQEIQGAVLPIAERHHSDAPFLGAVLAGVFTEGSLTQLKSVGFKVLHIPYEFIIEAFDEVGLDVRFDEGTPDEDFAHGVERMESLPQPEHQRLVAALLARCRPSLEKFLQALESSLDRIVDYVAVVPLTGAEHRFHSLTEAIDFLSGGDAAPVPGPVTKYDVAVRYSSGDSVSATFHAADRAVSFLRQVLG